MNNTNRNKILKRKMSIILLKEMSKPQVTPKKLLLLRESLASTTLGYLLQYFTGVSRNAQNTSIATYSSLEYPTTFLEKLLLHGLKTTESTYNMTKQLESC